jgi:hypothetical protein
VFWGRSEKPGNNNCLHGCANTASSKWWEAVVGTHETLKEEDRRYHRHHHVREGLDLFPVP